MLVLASPVACGSNGLNSAVYPSHFYEFDGTNLNEVTPSNPGVNGPDLTLLPSFVGRMLLLPSGRVLVTHHGDANDVWTYTPTGQPQGTWAPAITSAPTVIAQGETYRISGTQFNGFSQGAAYGDDAQMATNYPLVRITNNGSGHVFYARTHDHSRMGVEAVGDPEIVSTNFDVPTDLELGASTLVVVTNGISSAAVTVNVTLGATLTFTGASATSSDFNDAATVQAQLTSSGSPIQNEQITFFLGSGTGTETCSKATDSTGTATCQITPNQAAGNYTLTATFGGDSTNAGTSASTTFTVLPEDTTVAFTSTSATNADFDDAVTVAAVLTDPTDGNPIPGKAVTFALGSGGGSCVAPMTASNGLASCQIIPSQQAGSYTVTATFAGDAFDSASSASAPFTINKEVATTKFAATSPTVVQRTADNLRCYAPGRRRYSGLGSNHNFCDRVSVVLRVPNEFTWHCQLRYHSQPGSRFGYRERQLRG